MKYTLYEAAMPLTFPIHIKKLKLLHKGNRYCDKKNKEEQGSRKNNDKIKILHLKEN